MDAQAALAELLELSSQVEAAAILRPDGSLEASTLPEARATRLARCGRELLEAAAGIRGGDAAVTRVEVALEVGSAFAVREGERTIVATTVPEPTSGLVVYDLRTALRRLDERPAQKRASRRARDRAESADA